MELKLEQLEYQQQAVKAIISVFKGQEKNTIDNEMEFEAFAWR